MSESKNKQLVFSKRVSDTLRRKEDSSYVSTRSGSLGQLPIQLQNKEIQLECLKLLYLNHNSSNEYKEQGKTLIAREINTKIRGYAAQDRKKGIFNSVDLIKPDDVIDKLMNSIGKCYYCSCAVSLLYSTVRDVEQWTLERLDNSLGHSDANTVIACMKCNLARRCRSHEKFKAYKQLVIRKEESHP